MNGRDMLLRYSLTRRGGQARPRVHHHHRGVPEQGGELLRFHPHLALRTLNLHSPASPFVVAWRDEETEGEIEKIEEDRAKNERVEFPAMLDQFKIGVDGDWYGSFAPSRRQPGAERDA